MVFYEFPEKKIYVFLFLQVSEEKNGWLQALDWRWFLEGLFLFQVTVNFSYFHFINTLDFIYLFKGDII